MSLRVNPRMGQELQDDPEGEQAGKVKFLTLLSGRSIPVDYLRDETTVYAAADGSWWRELRDAGGRGSVLRRDAGYEHERLTRRRGARPSSLNLNPRRKEP